ncbi:hypothetical protein BGZ63DRAFT_429148 [Mariannaea sp. PMI_226]|nr:hypothetical protein BGZ63DRAFT_429148 [Mariannaea sp. PMI_226]
MFQTISETGASTNGASAVYMNIFGLEPVAKKQRVWDTRRLQSSATRDGDLYRLKGSKVWISTAQVAYKILVPVGTTPFDQVKKASHGLSLFYTDLDRSAVTVTKIPKMGC